MKKLKIDNIEKIDPLDYDSFFRVDINVEGNGTSLIVGKKQSGIGVDILSGHDVLKFFHTEENAYKVIGDAVMNLEKGKE